jgi:hypothetical protein
VTNKSNTVGKFVVNTAILLAKTVGSSRLRIAVMGAVVVLTVGIANVTGAFAIRKLGSTISGRAVTTGRKGKLRYPIG